MEKLWQAICNAKSVEEKKAILDKLDMATIQKLKEIKNPYRKPIYSAGSEYANISVINMPQEYMKNLMMTAMVSFMYKMAIEFKPKDDRPSEYEGDLGGEIARLKRKNSIRKPEEFYKQFAEKSDLDRAIWLRARARKYQAMLDDYKFEIKKAEDNAKLDPKKAEEVFSIKKKYESEIEQCEDQIKKLGVPEAEIILREVPLDDNENLAITELAKAKFGITQTREERECEIQDHLLDFLDYHFRFDPNNHIRCGYMPHYDPVIRERIRNNPEQFKLDATGKLIITDKFAEYLVPPRDTFAAFRNYFDANYEYLRQCTDDIYGEYNQFESALIVYETFPTEQHAKTWLDTYRKDIMADVYTVRMMNWAFIDSFAENRKKVRGADEKMRLVDRMVEQNTRDEKIAQGLIKKRGKKMPGRTGAMPFSQDLTDVGIDKLEDLADERDADKEEIEVKVYSTKLKRSGRRFIQVQDQFKFNVQAETEDEIRSRDKKTTVSYKGE